MKHHTAYRRCYHRRRKAYYANAKEPVSVGFGIYAHDGISFGAMEIEWVVVGVNIFPKLICFDDGWSALHSFADVIEKMGQVDEQNITEPDFCKLLDSCGFKDITKYIDPDLSTDPPQQEMVKISIPKATAMKLGLI